MSDFMRSPRVLQKIEADQRKVSNPDSKQRIDARGAQSHQFHDECS